MKTRAALILIVTLFVTATISLLWPVALSPDARYKHMVRKMGAQILAAEQRAISMESSEHAERARIEVLRALHTALANGQCQMADVSRDKVRSIATDLGNDPAMLRTQKGVYLLWQRFESACPSLRHYSRISFLRQMQSEGLIPASGERRGSRLKVRQFSPMQYRPNEAPAAVVAHL